tara:strand:+ start:49748 stop:50392 length:645 start_codon:yes stop_codon:yes gene_type:complete
MGQLGSMLSEHSKLFFTDDQLTTEIDVPSVVCEPCEGEGFTQASKCCTYFPFVANYSIGADIEFYISKFGKKGLVTFLGLHPEKKYRDQFALNGFGKGEGLGCPLFQNGSCSDWSRRSTECQFYFCKPWTAKSMKKDLRNYMNDMEMGLAQMAAVHAGADQDELKWSIDVFSHNESPWLIYELQDYFKDCHKEYMENRKAWIVELQKQFPNPFN